MSLFRREACHTANDDMAAVESPLVSVLRDCRLISVELDAILDGDEFACRKTYGPFKETPDRLGHGRDTIRQTGQDAEQLLSAWAT